VKEARSPDGSTSAASVDARREFERYLHGVLAGQSVDFEALCRQHPALAADLRQLHEAWVRDAATRPAGAASVSARISGIVGKDVDARVALDQTAHDGGALEHGNIGRYRILNEVARGGQGAILRVYDQDLRRRLAMKVVLGEGEQRGSGASVASVAPKTLGRFLEEAQVTAQLDHPGIVPVHELGLDSDGRVYFTMRLVKGENLGVIYDKTRNAQDGWSRTRTLNVLVKVCEAMSYAHHKGVIHRDLKPANVMVGRFGEVYVMDWGLARVVDRGNGRDARIDTDALANGDSSDSDDVDGLMTMDGDIVGTPAYMPPEQARGTLSEMGPHSDVYSLGAMLYELLAGHAPYSDASEKRNVFEILMAVQNERPRSLDRIARDAPQELVAICDKAMERDPAQRYPDMSGLAEDLRAFLEGRVVAAHERGAIAELRKWITRNRSLAFAMAAGVLVLLVGLVATLIQKGRADRNALLAHEREETALTAEAKAVAEAGRANREAETAKQTADFLVDLFQVVDPGEARGNTITAREILDRGAKRIETELADQPEIQSALMDTMGSVYKSLGLYGQALPLLERSLQRRIETHGADDLLVSDAQTRVGEVLRLQAQYAQAEPVLRRALELRRSQLGEENAAVAESMYQLGVVLNGMNRFPEAEQLFRKALEIRRTALGRHPDVAETLNALAFNLFDQGDRDAPEPLLRESLEIRQELLGEHPATAESLNDLGVYLFERASGSPPEADAIASEELLRSALAMKRKLYTDVHPEVALSLNNLASIYRARGDLDEAERSCLEALAIQRKLLGEAHPDIAQAMHNVAILRQNKGDWEGARELFLESLAMFRQLYGDGHPSVARPLSNTIEFLRELVDHRRETAGEKSLDYASALADLANALVLAGNQGEALDVGLQALEPLEADAAADPVRVAFLKSALGAAWTADGQLEQAEELLLQSYEVQQRTLGAASPDTRETLRRLVTLYETWKRPEADRFRALLPETAPGR